MHGKKLDDAKKEIRSVLLTYKDSVILREFLKTYRNLLGHKLPSRDLGFPSDVDFLISMPDVVDVRSDSRGEVYLSGIADKASQHIQKLVSRQRKSKPNSSKFNTRQPVSKLPSIPLNTRELKPFLPGPLRVEILELMSSYNDAVTSSAFVIAYHRKFKKFLPLIKGINSLEGIIKLIPQLEVGRNDNNEIIFYKKECFRNAEIEKGRCTMDEKASGITTDEYVVQENSSFSIHESGISSDILNDFQMVLQQCPDGIQNIHFPPLYEKIAGKPFDVVELGYNSMADLVEALPHIFQRVSNPANEQCWLIYPSGSQIKQRYKGKKVTDSPSNQLLYQNQEGIPADVSSPTLQYIQSAIPDNINLNEYIPVFVSAIINPSLFWFQLQTDEYIKKFDKLEKDMRNFYLNAGDKYKMNNADIAIGATCVIQCPDDNQFYRAVIKSIPSAELINVSFVDYGSRDNIPRKNVHYVWSKFHEYPAYAFQAQLASLKPPGNADIWSSEARKRFVELCNCTTLMAFIKFIGKDNYYIYLCDTNGDEDIYLNDTLINEGYAETFHENQSDLNTSNSSEPGRISNGHDILVNSPSNLINNQDVLQSDSSDVSMPESNELPVNRKLSFPVDVKNNDVSLNASPFSKSKLSKRYIKEVEVCKGSKIHLINLESKLFMSCDELCSLLWSDKNTNFLIRRLMHKEIDIPFHHIKKENYSELFKQCLWYKVPGFEKKALEDSSLVLCPLEESFNVLNIFGHPSVCLRVIMQHEMRIFDPDDEFWNEFSYQESSEICIAESEILEEINNFCLYDLKAKSEAFKIQKLKLLRLHSNPQSEEIRRIEYILNVITRRMKQIEAICVQYSSCS